ncbi:MAG: hypothetical protein AAGC57_00155 [Pseudomonadota bacterium]
MELALSSPEATALSMWQTRARAAISDHFRRDDAQDAKPRHVNEVLEEHGEAILCGRWDGELAEQMVFVLHAKGRQVRLRAGRSLDTLAVAISEWRRCMRPQITDIDENMASA